MKLSTFNRARLLLTLIGFALIPICGQAQTKQSGKTIANGTLPQAALSATGSETSSTWLRGDWTWASLPLTTELQGFPISTATPASGNLLEWDGSQWGPTPIASGQVVFGTATVAATSNRTLSGSPYTIDGVGVSVGSVVLCTAQTTTSENGPWVVQSGAWVRPSFYPTGASIAYGRVIYVDQGTSTTGYLRTFWSMTTGGGPIVDTDPTSWVMIQTSLQNAVLGILPLANGGTNANLTANNGGIFYSTASAASILAGTATANQVLLSGASSAPSWSTATYPATAGTIGNILASDGTNIVSQVLTTSQIPATTNYRYVTFVFGNGGSVLTTGLVNADASFNGAATLVAVYLKSTDSTSGSVTVDILRHNAGIPTSGDSIVGGGGTKPAISSSTYAKDTTFTSWTSTTFAADDEISLNLTAVTSIKYLSVTLCIQVS